jgi:hypothetical protein
MIPSGAWAIADATVATARPRLPFGAAVPRFSRHISRTATSFSRWPPRQRGTSTRRDAVQSAFGMSGFEIAAPNGYGVIAPVPFMPVPYYGYRPHVHYCWIARWGYRHCN